MPAGVLEALLQFVSFGLFGRRVGGRLPKSSRFFPSHNDRLNYTSLAQSAPELLQAGLLPNPTLTVGPELVWVIHNPKKTTAMAVSVVLDVHKSVSLTYSSSR